MLHRETVTSILPPRHWHSVPAHGSIDDGAGSRTRAPRLRCSTGGYQQSVKPPTMGFNDWNAFGCDVERDSSSSRPPDYFAQLGLKKPATPT